MLEPMREQEIRTLPAIAAVAIHQEVTSRITEREEATR
jgi:hypothetical protein